ncbi:serotransferrin [Eublepharis macularius]|uniref:Serotransferrin n=1 Tax=Eublepharis macularius TaxID=481883 RepID=A0AA97L0X4_EUBMA|nr:serotransferrin [Eublepharis macularius]
MTRIFQATIGLLALCLVTHAVKWCTVSDAEQAKCMDLQTCLKGNITMHCVKKTSYHDCIQAIANSEADAISLDGGLIYDAGLAPYHLKPIAAEVYGEECATSYYTVAVVKKGTVNSLSDLRGKKSCHTGFGRSAGWNVPIGILLEKGYIQWAGAENEPIQKAVARFFLASCVPGVPNEPSLCRLCIGEGEAKCSASDPYAGYSGALRCLMDGVGDVAFVKQETVLSLSEEERNKYELLCYDGTKRPVEQYRSCNLARVPAHAVVARSDGHIDEIWELISTLQKRYPKGTQGTCQFFGSSHGKDLMCKDSAMKFIRVPLKVDTQLYLGPQYLAAIQNVRKERPAPDTTNRVRWCTVGKNEKAKCDTWSAVSGGAIECAVADNTEDAIVKILKGEADAMSLDGGLIYVAGECGLVPVASEITDQRDIEACRSEGTQIRGTYVAVAVVKKSNRKITWKNLRGKKSCHTGRDRTAGWNIPMGMIINETGITDVDHFFSEGCAPGSPPESPLCSLCVGSGSSISDQYKCAPNSHELYYGYTGAFRCLVEKGDVCFVKGTTVPENTNGNNQEAWASKLKSEDFELLCRNGERRPITSSSDCNLGQAPPHGVVAHPDRADLVRRVMNDQEALFGSKGSQKDIFQMFQPDPKNKDLLFKDRTICLGKVKKGATYRDLLGSDYVDAISSIKKISPSALVEACRFHQHVCSSS